MPPAVVHASPAIKSRLCLLTEGLYFWKIFTECVFSPLRRKGAKNVFIILIFYSLRLCGSYIHFAVIRVLSPCQFDKHLIHGEGAELFLQVVGGIQGGNSPVDHD